MHHIILRDALAHGFIVSADIIFSDTKSVFSLIAKHLTQSYALVSSSRRKPTPAFCCAAW